MKFKVNKVVAAVAVSLGTSVVGMTAAQADEVFFPYVVSSDTVTTILSVMNDDDYSIDQLHYRYWYKTGAALTNTASCDEANYRENTSSNDIVTFDVSGKFGDDKGVLFEPTAVQVNAKYDKDFSVFRTIKPTRAFALVDNNDKFYVGQNVEGEAFIIEYVAGAVWGYHAYNAASIVAYNPSTGNYSSTDPYEFSDRVETTGEVLVTPRAGVNPEDFWAPIAVMPFEEVTTALFVTPVATTGPNYQNAGNISAKISLQAVDNASVNDAMFDRDENPISGRVPATVTCVGKVLVEDMISAAALQYLQSGGWTNVGVESGQAVVMKLEYNDSANPTLDGTPTVGVYNNGFWLRKGIRESMTRYPVQGTSSTGLVIFDSVQAQENSMPFPVIDTEKAAALGLPLPPPQDATAIQYLPAAADEVSGAQ